MTKYKKIIKIGNSLGITLDKNTIEINELKIGDTIAFDIRKVIREKRKISLEDLSPELINEIKAIAIEELKKEYAENKQ